jgi:6-pyruvoyltetrahydropterin/6-carboxytetrahydropterin synthase
MITANRYHDISVGHRVHGHESKCAHLHGHNYRVHFEVEAPKLDAVGRVMDFSVIKSRLCMWLEDNWDHKFLAWEEDVFMRRILQVTETWGNDVLDLANPAFDMLNGSLIWVPFNPTAENMAEHLVEVIGPQQLEGTSCTLTRVVIEETRKCSCSYTKE